MGERPAMLNGRCRCRVKDRVILSFFVTESSPLSTLGSSWATQAPKFVRRKNVSLKIKSWGNRAANRRLLKTGRARIGKKEEKPGQCFCRGSFQAFVEQGKLEGPGDRSNAA